MKIIKNSQEQERLKEYWEDRMKRALQVRSKLGEQQKKKLEEELLDKPIPETLEDEASNVNKEVGTSTAPQDEKYSLRQEKECVEVEQAKAEA